MKDLHDKSLQQMKSHLEHIETQKNQSIELQKKELTVEKEKAITEQQAASAQLQSKMNSDLEELRTE